MDRRNAIGLGMIGAAALSARAVADTVLPGDGSIPSDPKEIVAIWPGVPPGGESVHLPNRVSDRAPAGAPPDRYADQVGMPTLTVFRPDRPNGSAVIIAPGGGYVREMLELESYETARRLNGAGVTAMVLRYRLPGEGWADRSNVPLQDAQRAIRLVRANAAHYGIDPARLGFMGFSAGGHVAVSIATRFAASVYNAIDAADALDARPAFVVAMYPVVTMGDGAHAGSRDNLLGPSPAADQVVAYSAEKTVTAATPPVFICLAADDKTVPPLPNGIAFFVALRTANIPAELHVFEQGGHGFGIGKTAGKPASAWPDLLIAWARSHGFFNA